MATSLSYQELSNNLDEVLTKLQQPELDITQALKLYSQGQELLHKLEAHLKTAESKINKLKLDSE